MNLSLPKVVSVKSDDHTDCETTNDKTVSFEDNCISRMGFVFVRSNELMEVKLTSFREAKSISKQEVLIMVICPSEVVQWTETMLSKLVLFPYIHWVGLNFVNFVT